MCKQHLDGEKVSLEYKVSSTKEGTRANFTSLARSAHNVVPPPAQGGKSYSAKVGTGVDSKSLARGAHNAVLGNGRNILLVLALSSERYFEHTCSFGKRLVLTFGEQRE